MSIKIVFFAVSTFCALNISAQNAEWYYTTKDHAWAKTNVKLKSLVTSNQPDIEIPVDAEGVKFKSWGTTFNELDWDALLMLSRDEQDEIMHNLFSPDGDLKFTRGRIGMNCNDYGRSWFSCDEVQGDLELRYFNIDRDKTSIIPLIRVAQKYNPSLTF